MDDAAHTRAGNASGCGQLPQIAAAVHLDHTEIGGHGIGRVDDVDRVRPDCPMPILRCQFDLVLVPPRLAVHFPNKIAGRAHITGKRRLSGSERAGGDAE